MSNHSLLEALKTAMPEFRQQDDWLLSGNASLMSEDSHEIIHVDTVLKIAAAIAATASPVPAATFADDEEEACSSCGLTMRQSRMLAALSTKPSPDAGQKRHMKVKRDYSTYKRDGHGRYKTA